MVAVGAQAQERESNEASVLREVTRVHSELYVLHFVLNLLYINISIDNFGSHSNTAGVTAGVSTDFGILEVNI